MAIIYLEQKFGAELGLKSTGKGFGGWSPSPSRTNPKRIYLYGYEVVDDNLETVAELCLETGQCFYSPQLVEFFFHKKGLGDPKKISGNILYWLKILGSRPCPFCGGPPDGPRHANAGYRSEGCFEIIHRTPPTSEAQAVYDAYNLPSPRIPGWKVVKDWNNSKKGGVSRVVSFVRE